MYRDFSSIIIEIKLNEHLELILNHIKSTKNNSNLIKNFIKKIHIDLNQRYELRNNYYHRKYPLLIHDLCLIKSMKNYFQFIEKQNYHSIQFYRNVFNLQSLNNIEHYHQQYEQSIKYFNELEDITKQYENDLNQLKENIFEQNKQINIYSNYLFQIQFEQKQIQSNIQQLKQKILLEKRFYYEIKRSFICNSELILNQFHTEYINLTTQINQIKFNIEQKSMDLLPLQYQLSIYRTIFNMNDISFIQTEEQPLIRNTEEIQDQSVLINENIIQSEQQELPMEFVRKSEDTKSISRKKSLGPNLQSRLEALEAAMGVRLNLAKRQGRHSLSNTTSPSPMQVSPTSTSISNSLSTSSRHNIPTRSGQGVQRSASSCDVENRPGPIKRLKPTLPNENSAPPSSSTAAAIATIKKYPPQVRRPLLTTNQTPTRSTQSKQSTPMKQRSSPMDTSSPRLSRSSTTSTNSSSNSSHYRTPIGGASPKICNSPSPKQIIANSSPRPPITNSRKQRLSIFGEQFSADILKINLLWLDLKELDDESRSEVILQFGSIENFLREQNFFFTKQQQQLKLAAKNKTIVNRSRFQLFLPKKDRLELL